MTCNHKFKKISGKTSVCTKCGALKVGDTKIYPDYIDFALLTSAPTAVEGRIYYNSSDHKLYYYNGTSWVSFG